MASEAQVLVKSRAIKSQNTHTLYLKVGNEGGRSCHTYYTVKTSIAAWSHLSHPAPNLEKNA